MNDTIKRLSALKHSLEGARDTKHPIPMPLIDGMNIGLQIAIDAIDRELETIAAGQAAAALAAQPD